MDYEIIEQYQNEQGKKLYNLKIGEESFNGIMPIAKINSEMCRKCKYYNFDENCCSNGPIFRGLDCKIKKEKLQKGFIGTVAGATAFVSFLILKCSQVEFFTKLLFLIAGVVVLDVASVTVKKIAIKIYNKSFYKMLKRNEAERVHKEKYYGKVKEAREVVKQLRNTSDRYNFGPNEEKIKSCVETCEEILNKLREDTLGYSEVMALFEVYIPAFLSTLEKYIVLSNDGADREENEKALTECVDTILLYVEQNAKGDQQTAKIMFKASTNALKNQLQREIK